MRFNEIYHRTNSICRSDVKLGIAFYYAQLAMNFIWSPLFFNGKKVCSRHKHEDNTHVKNQLGLALIDSVLLAGTTFCMTVCICQLHGSRVEITLWLQKLLDGPTKSQSTYLLLPYCAWLTFATYLNGGIWWLNRGQTPKKD